MPQTSTQSARIYSAMRLLQWLMLAVAAVFFVLHFLHLNADFPNDSPWMDWSKYTDEGWYGDAAIRQILSGHWYWPGDFNPAVALPVWPALEWVVFHFTGVSPAAARALTLVVVGVTLLVLYRLIARHTHSRNESEISLAPALAVLFLCCNPFLYAFDRVAIVEPLLICLTAAALMAASHLHPLKRANAVEILKSILPSVALGILMPAMVLTKTTAVSLLPAIAYMVWARAGYRLRPALRLAAIPCLLGAAIWLGYFYGFVRPHYLADYRYLFSANGYTGIGLDPLATVLLNTVKDGMWMGSVLFVSFFVVLALVVFCRPRLLANPLVPALTLWVVGYTAFLLFHNNLQPRYYTVIAVPITVLVAIGLDNFRYVEHRAARVIATTAVAVVVLAIVVPDAIEMMDFVLHPTYEFEAAAENIKRIVLADPKHSHLVLSISGSDLTLMTGLPSINDDFGTLDLDVRAREYQPGWYVAWNDIEDDKMEDLAPYFRIERVASFTALDDPERNQMILYRLDPATEQTTAKESEPAPPEPARKVATPKPLLTKAGQQPSTEQLQH